LPSRPVTPAVRARTPIVFVLVVALVAFALPTQAAETSFSDVANNTHRWAIKAVEDAGITRGCEPGRFCPRATITRSQMASFLARAGNLSPRSHTFSDVSSRNTHAGAIGAIQHAGITEGCAPGRFCPNDPVTRAQMATFLARALDLSGGSVSQFSDVRAGHTHAPGIGAVAADGITRGCASGLFCPNDPVTRDQMATFIARGLDLDRGLDGCPAVGATTNVRFGAAARGLPLSAGERIGDKVYAFSLDLTPARITEFDLQTGQPGRTVEIPQGTRTWATHVLDDKLYFGMWRRGTEPENLYEFDPATGQVTQIATIDTGGEFWSLTSDGEHTLYAGTARAGRVTRIDLQATPDQRVSNLTFSQPPGASGAHVTTLEYADGQLYIGLGRKAPRLAVYDLDTGVTEHVALPPAIQDVQSGGIYSMAVSDEHLAIGTQQDDAVLAILDRHDDLSPTHVKVFDGDPSNPLDSEPVISGVSIHEGSVFAAGNGSGSLYELVLDGDGSVETRGVPLKHAPTRTIMPTNGDIVGISGANSLWEYDRADSTLSVHDLAPNGGGGPLLPQSLSVSSDSALVGTNNAVFLRRLNNTSATRRVFVPGEPKAAVAVGSDHYFVNYPHATLWRIGMTSEPELVADWVNEQNRPLDVRHDAPNGRVLVATESDFAGGGAVVTVQLSDGHTDVVENPLGASSGVTRVRPHGSRAIIGGKGQAPMASIDPLTGAERWRTTAVSGGTAITGLEVIGNDIYGLTQNGWFFRLDARTGNQLREPVRVFNSGGGELIVKAGAVYAVNTDRLVSVDPVTDRVRAVTTGLNADVLGRPALRTDDQCRLYVMRERELRRLEHDIWSR
jgi:outer membrane protein assembly factor BamB